MAKLLERNSLGKEGYMQLMAEGTVPYVRKVMVGGERAGAGKAERLAAAAQGTLSIFFIFFSPGYQLTDPAAHT